MIKDNMNQWLEKNYDELVEITRRNCKGKGKFEKEYLDICHELMAELLSLNLEKQLHLLNTNAVKYYFVRMVRLSVISPTSKYQRKYNSKNLDFWEDYDGYDIPDSSYDTFYDDVQEIIATRLPWDCTLVMNMHILELMTFKKIADKTKIPPISLYNIYKTGKEIVKQIYNDEYRDKD